jgi:hypothetical protein
MYLSHKDRKNEEQFKDHLRSAISMFKDWMRRHLDAFGEKLRKFSCMRSYSGRYRHVIKRDAYIVEVRDLREDNH